MVQLFIAINTLETTPIGNYPQTYGLTHTKSILLYLMMLGLSHSSMTQKGKFTPLAEAGIAQLCPANGWTHLEGPKLLHLYSRHLDGTCSMVGSAGLLPLCM